MVTLLDNTTANANSESLKHETQLDAQVPKKATQLFGEISVNGIVIEESEILHETQNHAASTPGDALQAAAKALVIRELLWQEAINQGIEPCSEDFPDGRHETDKDAVIRQLIEQEVTVPDATESECRRYFELNQSRFRSDPIFEARHILLTCSQDDKEARASTLVFAKDLTVQLSRDPDRFGELAEQFSDCPSGKVGGNLGQLTKGTTVAEFESALLKMREGTLSSNPVESRFGYHIIALDRRVDGDILPFRAVESRLKAWLEASSWSKAVSQYIGILAGLANIEGITLNGADTPLVQ